MKRKHKKSKLKKPKRSYFFIVGEILNEKTGKMEATQRKVRADRFE